MSTRPVRHLVRAVPDRGEPLVFRQLGQRARLGQRCRRDTLDRFVENDHRDVVGVVLPLCIARVAVEGASVSLIAIHVCRIEGDPNAGIAFVAAVRGGQEDGR